MAGSKRCFVTVRALKRLNERLLCEILRKFPHHLQGHGLTIPDPPTRDTLYFEGIRDACVASDIPADLEDVLFFVSILGNKRGQEQIEREAAHRKRPLSFSRNGLTCADFAMQAWLHNWPHNRDLLEAAYAGARIHGKSAYDYNPMLRDVRANFQNPTPERIAEARGRMEDYFANREGLGKGTNIILYDYPHEVWFLVRYPGQMERHAGYDEEGNQSTHVFRPEEYDAIVYHKTYGDLRLNTNRKRDHLQYRVVFGHLLFEDANVFDPKTEMVRLDPLLGECRSIFNCRDIEGLAEIHPIEISFAWTRQPTVWLIWRSDKDMSLLADGLYGNNLLPPEAHSIAYAKFIYRLSHRTDWGRITVHKGRSLTYERDGDSVVVEEWLRRRKFVKNPIDINHL